MTALPETEGRLPDNIVHFTRALRRAGVRIGTSQVEDAVRAVQMAGFTSKRDFYHTLRACLITRAEHLALFDQTFAMFWRDPEFLEAMLHLLSPTLRKDMEKARPKPSERRAAEALTDQQAPGRQAPEREEVQVEAELSWSASERLKAMDFEAMSLAETREAEAAIRRLTLPVPPLKTRRLVAMAQGTRPDLRASLRRSLRRGGELDRIVRRGPRLRPPTLVALCDISGSMTVYSRMMMHFLHALAHAETRSWGPVHAFTFGTRLTNVTRALTRRDADAALAQVGAEAQDWQGGTRIGEALHRFNKDWSRRVLGQGAAVLLITDGLERDRPDLLAAEAERLAKSCRRIIWLNPLLRFDGFEPRAAGIRALMPHVSSFHACHTLDSLGDLARALGSAAPERMAARLTS